MSRQADAHRRELERKSQDEIMVHNPTGADFHFKYNGFNHVVPKAQRDIGHGKGNAVFPRYIAMNFMKKMVDHLIASEAQGKAEHAKKSYKGNHFAEEELKINKETYADSNRAKHIKNVWRGVVREFGLEELPEEHKEPVSRSGRSTDEALLEEIGLDHPVDLGEMKSEDDFINEVSQ